jgi:hypothetical protein
MALRESVESFIALMGSHDREFSVERIPDSKNHKITHIPSGITLRHNSPILSKASYFVEPHLELSQEEQYAVQRSLSAWIYANQKDVDDFHDELIAAKLKGFL